MGFKVDFGKWLPITVSVLMKIPAAFAAIENIKMLWKGKEKEDAAIEVLKSFLPLAETAADQDLLKDEKVEEAIREVFKTLATVQNVIAAVKASKTAPVDN